MVHNHFLVFAQEELRTAPAAAADDPNLTDSGNHGLFLQYLAQVYLRFFEILDLEILEPVPADEAQLKVTGYPQGLPSWRVRGGARALESGRFWQEYDMVLEGFLDFYRTFFGLVATSDTLQVACSPGQSARRSVPMAASRRRAACSAAASGVAGGRTANWSAA